MDASDSVGDGALLREARELTPALYALGRVLRLRGAEEAGLTPLPPSDLDVLRHVLDTPGVGVGAVAQALGLHGSNVSTTVRGLVARGLIRREPDPHDRRAVRLHPTMGAVQGMAKIEEAWSEIFADALATLPEDDRAALFAAVPALSSLASSLRARRG
ncbi:MarR family winged helix-turn-helix transcriptional regulator [Streptomyces sp. NRRL F-5135]|uniref:MarR family winged helix-turn-helix transcriptional regulator n=1 Tax=Streptomyces sp. NRRL F-5135 TaxID=1463858 RepID=UPI00068DDCCA|nr:MarR family winged helix-turn-helix transcriptional regulator [Streptomyces sp. NRRL F-5135]